MKTQKKKILLRRNLLQKRNKRVMMSSKRERRKREDKGKTRRRERARTIQDLSLSIRRRIIRSTGTDLGRDLQPVTVLRREEISFHSAMISLLSSARDSSEERRDIIAEWNANFFNKWWCMKIFKSFFIQFIPKIILASSRLVLDDRRWKVDFFYWEIFWTFLKWGKV